VTPFTGAVAGSRHGWRRPIPRTVEQLLTDNPSPEPIAAHQAPPTGAKARIGDGQAGGSGGVGGRPSQREEADDERSGRRTDDPFTAGWRNRSYPPAPPTYVAYPQLWV
jgi:hypothetical protein